MTPVIRLQPWQELALLQGPFDRRFERGPVPSKIEAREWKPAIEMQMTALSVILKLEVPGIEAKDLDVQVTREAVFVKGQRPVPTPETKGFFHSEMNYGRCDRRIPLPVPIANNQVEAQLKNGILTLTLPKLSAVRPEVVKVSIGQSDRKQQNDRGETRLEVPSVQVTEPTDLETDPWAA